MHQQIPLRRPSVLWEFVRNMKIQLEKQKMGVDLSKITIFFYSSVHKITRFGQNIMNLHRKTCNEKTDLLLNKPNCGKGGRGWETSLKVGSCLCFILCKAILSRRIHLSMSGAVNQLLTFSGRGLGVSVSVMNTDSEQSPVVLVPSPPVLRDGEVWRQATS